MDNANVYDIERVKGTDADLQVYKNCFDNNNTPRSIENIYWLHRHNVLSRSIIFNAIEKSSGGFAALYTVVPVQFKLGNTLQPAAQSIDTITVEKHRGKGLFVKTAAMLYSTMATENYALVYGFPNHNSAHGLFNKLSWRSYGEVPFLVKPLRFSFILKKLFGSHRSKSDSNHQFEAPEEKIISETLRIKKIHEFSDEYEEFWNLVSKNFNVCVNRNTAYMNWRYVKKPDQLYHKYGIYENNKLVGITLFTIKNKHDGRIGYLMEHLYLPEHLTASKKLLKFANKQIAKQKADLILAWNLPHSYNRISYRKCGYVPFPEKLRPQQLYFGVKAFDSDNEQLIYDQKNWYLSYSDSDTV